MYCTCIRSSFRFVTLCLVRHTVSPHFQLEIHRMGTEKGGGLRSTAVDEEGPECHP